MNSPKIVWPLIGKYPISFLFREAPEWYTKIFGYPHNGIDIACPIGTVVRATDDGIVTFCDDIPDGDGKGIIITHSWGMSLYWHLNNLIAKIDQSVKQGENIGMSGNTGYVTGPHLHFAIKVTGEGSQDMRYWVNPLLYMSDDPIPPTPPPAIDKYYLVMLGDTLWKIAEKFYKNGLEWKRIYLANQDKIKNPNIIYPLQRLLIP